MASWAPSRLVIFHLRQQIVSSLRTRHSSCSRNFSKFISHRRCQSMILALGTTRHLLMRVHIENRTQMSILLQQKSQKLGFQVSRMFPFTSEDKNCTTYAACFLFFPFRVAHCAWSHWFSPEKRRHKRCLSCAWTFFFVFFASPSHASTFDVEDWGKERSCQLLVSFSFMMLVASWCTLATLRHLGRSVSVGGADFFNLVFKTIIINSSNKLRPLIVA